MRRFLCALIISAATLSAQEPQAVQQIGQGPNIYSRDREVAIGTQLAQEVQGAVTPMDNAAALSYVEQMGAKLAAQLPEPRFNYTFALLPASEGDFANEPLALPVRPHLHPRQPVLDRSR
jgi:hypothetical protein